MIRVAVANSKRMCTDYWLLITDYRVPITTFLTHRHKSQLATHQSFSSGYKFVNFTLERGSAIIGATRSRQVR